MAKAVHHSSGPASAVRGTVPIRENGGTAQGHGSSAGAAASPPVPNGHGRGSREPLAFSPSSEFSKLSNSAKTALSDASLTRNYGPNEFVYLQDDDAEFAHIIADAWADRM